MKVLCVDDEPLVLRSLSMNLGRAFEVRTATRGAQALDILANEPDIAVIVSDMRMPNMDGPTFLGRSRKFAPDAIRVVLTGQAQLDAAIAAVNQGRLFRFLTKPCAPPALMEVLIAAGEEHRRVVAERVKLEQTLDGCLKGIAQLLAIADSAAFARADRMRMLAGTVADCLKVSDRRQIEAAAMLSRVAVLASRAEAGAAPTSEMTVAANLVAAMPGLEQARDILQALDTVNDAQGVRPADLPLGAGIVCAVLELDELEGRRHLPWRAIAAMRETGRHDRQILATLDEVASDTAHVLRDVALAELRPGMVLGADLKTRSGTLIAARDHEVTAPSLKRFRELAATVGVVDPVRVVLWS